LQDTASSSNGIRKVPDQWTIFGTRSSQSSTATRNTSDSISALLKHVYAILETEVRLASLIMRLDPTMGILRADLKSRGSFVFDLIQPVRPVVDGSLFTMLEERTLTAREFFEIGQGVCRLEPSLPQAHGEMSPRLAKLVASVGKQVAQRLSPGQEAAARPLTVPASLTQSNQSSWRG
jgi:CRISPR/Cas system-associated endonuclease Cas1